MKLFRKDTLRKQILYPAALCFLACPSSLIAKNDYSDLLSGSLPSNSVTSCKLNIDSRAGPLAYENCLRRDEEYKKLILEDGGYVYGKIFVCKKIEYFELRRPKDSQCWYLKSGSNVTVKNLGPRSKIQYGILPWQSAYGDVYTCHQRTLDCIQTHTHVK